MDRRRFLSLAAATTAATALPSPAAPSAAAAGPAAAADASPAADAGAAAGPAGSKPGSLKLIFFTDTHTQPELKAGEGTALAMAKIKSLKPDLCIQGGDHCFDLAAVPRDRSLMLLDLYTRTEQALNGLPIHHVIGNHDILGRVPASGVTPTDPLYGKKAFEQRFNTRTYRSFNERGYHFILLDSIQITPEREFDAMIDPAQLIWLAADLAATPPGTPIVVVSHVPLVSAAPQYSPPDDKAAKAQAYQALTNLHGFLVGNSRQTIDLFEGHHVIAVLQGHTHINEAVFWRDVPYVTSGAVSGNWWRGTRWGTPEGFTVLELANGHAQWHYETYGWKSPEATPDPLQPLPHPAIL